MQQAGLAALVAPQVANSGVITARLGHVVLAGAETATLDLYGDGLVSIDVTGQVVQAPNGAHGAGDQYRADPGRRRHGAADRARGGRAWCRPWWMPAARSAPTRLGGRTGTIVLNGGRRLDHRRWAARRPRAARPAPPVAAIEVNASGSGDAGGGARVSASGQAGGGTMAIGTTLARPRAGRGTASTQTAANVHGGGGRHASPPTPQRRAMAGGSPCCRSCPPAWTARSAPRAGRGRQWRVRRDLRPNALHRQRRAWWTPAPASPSGTPGTWLLDPLDLDVGGSGRDTNVSELVGPPGPPFTVDADRIAGADPQRTSSNGELNDGTDVVLTTEGTAGRAAPLATSRSMRAPRSPGSPPRR